MNFEPAQITHSHDTFDWVNPTTITATDNRTGEIRNTWTFDNSTDASATWLTIALH